jgi:hypothetical protein
VVRVLGYRSGGPGSIPGNTRKKVMGLENLTEKKKTLPVYKHILEYNINKKLRQISCDDVKWIELLQNTVHCSVDVSARMFEFRSWYESI